MNHRERHRESQKSLELSLFGECSEKNHDR
jgi:hypothetical protein